MNFLFMLLFGVMLAACGTGGGGGPTCRNGCPCGRACISCSYTCHMERAFDNSGNLVSNPETFEPIDQDASTGE